MCPIFPSSRHTIYEEDKFYSSLMFVVLQYFQIDIVFHDPMVSGSFPMKVWTIMIQREYQLEVWTLIIQTSMVIPPSPMVLFFLVSVRAQLLFLCSFNNTAPVAQKQLFFVKVKRIVHLGAFWTLLVHFRMLIRLPCLSTSGPSI